MRFPVGLSARLMRRNLLHAFGSEPAPAIFHLSPLVKHFPDSAHDHLNAKTESHSPHECVDASAQAGAPVGWIGGAEPLFCAEIGELSCSLAKKGHYVFLHTSGIGLRKRIHEFEPLPRLYLSIEIPLDDSSVSESGALAAFQVVEEAIRVARLSGFYICGHFTLAGSIGTNLLATRIAAIQGQLVDGIVVSSGGACSLPSESKNPSRLLEQAMRMIPWRGWRSFSRLLEASYPQNLRTASYEPSNTQPCETDSCEETA